MTDYALINIDDPEDKKVFLVTRDYPTILPVEYPKPELDPKLFEVQENKLDEWEIHKDKVLATYTVTEKTLEEEKEKITKFFNHIYKVVRDGGLSIEDNGQKVFVSTKEENYEAVADSLKEIDDDSTIVWDNGPVQWDEVDKKKLQLMKSRIIDHYDRCDKNLDDLLELVDACQTIYALHEIEFLEGWPNVILVTYEDGTVRMFLMNELLDENGYLKYEKTAPTNRD